MSKELRPYVPTHPGNVLKDELQARGIRQKRFAEIISVSYTMLNEINNCKRPVSTEMALILEAALGINASLWNNMQSRYNLERHVGTKIIQVSLRLSKDYVLR